MKRDNDVRPLEGRYCHHKTVSAVVNWCIKTSLTWCNENAIGDSRFYALSWLWIPIGCEQFKSSVKSNRDYFGFPSLRSVIGLENSHLDQSDTKQNPSATRSLLFSPPLKKFASRALHLTVSFLLLSDVIAQYAGTLCMVSSSSNFSDSGNRGFKPRFWTQARILRYRVLKLSESRNV